MIPPFSFLASGGGAPVFDPATLSLTAWNRNFGGLPWAGTASAGSSGSRSIPNGTSGSTTLDGSGVLTLNGSTQSVSDNGNAVSAYLSASAYTLILLCRPKSPAAPSVGIYDDKQIWGSPGISHHGLAWSTSGVAMWHFDGGARNVTPWVASAANTWAMIVGRYNGTNIETIVNGGTPQSIASGNAASFGSGVFGLGLDYTSANFCQVDVAEVMAASTALSDPNLADILSYFQATYPSAGL